MYLGTYFWENKSQLLWYYVYFTKLFQEICFYRE